jgi:hypothetical protein
MGRTYDDKIAAGPKEAVAREEIKPARVSPKEAAELIWSSGPDHSLIAAGSEYDYRIFDRRSVFVIAISLRRGRGRLFRAEHQQRVIGVVDSL